MNVISAWDVYWVMQLDTIGTVACVAAFAGLIAVPMAWGMWADKTCGAPIIVPLLVSAFLVPAIAAATFLPSTKTAAAMIVLPAVANSEIVQTEAADLYCLAKKALADAIGEEPEAAQ